MAEQTLKEKTAKGLLWGGLNNGTQQLLNIMFGIFLARLLTRADYGMVAMLAIFSQVASSIQESGFTSALANKKNIRHEDYNAVFWCSILIALTLYVILFFCAPLIAAFYEKPELTPLGRYLFLSFVLSSLGTAHSAYLFRNLKVKERALSNIVALLLSGIVAVVLALNGYAYWGIATQTLIFVGTNTIGYWILSDWRPTLNFNLSPVKEFFGFSSKMLITNVFYHINNNVLPLILGKFYTPNEVGDYNQAHKWNYMAHILITNMVSGVAQPVLVQTGNEQERQRRIFRKMLRFTAFISFPAMLGLSLIAPEFITITITDKWINSAHILQILCVGGAFLPIAALYSNLIVSKGKSNIYMWSNISLGLLQLLVIILLRNYGITTMVMVYVAINIAWMFVWQYFIWKEIRLSLLHAVIDILPFAATALGAMTVAYYASSLVENIYLSITIKIFVAALIYIIIMWISGSVIFKEALAFFMKKKISI